MNKKTQPIVIHTQDVSKNKEYLSAWIKSDMDFQIWNMQINNMMYNNVTTINTAHDEKEAKKEGK